VALRGKIGRDGVLRANKNYNGSLMEAGKIAEEIVFKWLKENPYGKEVIDTREFRFSQRLDVDCGIEDMHGRIVLGEIKSDKWLGKSQNILFETNRINHFVPPYFYLGWGWRSPAERLYYYSPHLNAIYVFKFTELRKQIGIIISQTSPEILHGWIKIVTTDKQKTTFNFVIPEELLINCFKIYKL